MLEIKANKNVFLDGEKVNLSPGEYEDFFIRCYKIELSLDKTLTLGDFLDVIYPIKNDIKKRYLEEFDAFVMLVKGAKLSRPAKAIKIHKSIEDNDGIVSINTQVDIVSSGANDARINVISGLTFEFDNKLVDVNDILKTEKKCKFMLGDVVEVLFEDLIYAMRNENLIM